MNAFWIICTGILVAVSCSSLGSFLVLQRKTMLADAISHAVLPGIALAYLLSGTRSPFWMLAGASLAGVFTAFLVEWLEKKAGVQTDSSIGVTYTWLFALGIILISAFAAQTDLDQDCVLFGELVYVPLSKVQFAGIRMPRQTLQLLPVTALVLLFIAVFYPVLKLFSFDPAFARMRGLRGVLLHYLFMAMVSLCTVFSFESVGAILVVALLVIPAVTARMLSGRLHILLLYAGLLAIASVLGGYGMAWLFDNTLSACIALCSALLFVLVFGLKQLFLKRTQEKIFRSGAESGKMRV